MCIRDRDGAARDQQVVRELAIQRAGERRAEKLERRLLAKACLLYTSDAADERSSVDLGGRRIIKKKKDRVAGEDACQSVKH